MTNLALDLREAAQMYPDRPAVRLDDTTLTYAELDQASARLARLLGLEGFEPGDRVGLMLPNVPEFAVIYYGVLRAGGVVVPMNPLLKEREVEYYVQDSGARYLFAWHELAPGVAEAAREAGYTVMGFSVLALQRIFVIVRSMEKNAERKTSKCTKTVAIPNTTQLPSSG